LENNNINKEGQKENKTQTDDGGGVENLIEGKRKGEQEKLNDRSRKWRNNTT
jgi:hypothetical protein